MPERADHIPPQTKWDCLQPDPMEGIVCKRCGGGGEEKRQVLDTGRAVATSLRCAECGGRGKP